MNLEKIYDEIVDLLEKRGVSVKQFSSKQRLMAYSDETHRINIAFHQESIDDVTVITRNGNKLIW